MENHKQPLTPSKLWRVGLADECFLLGKAPRMNWPGRKQAIGSGCICLYAYPAYTFMWQFRLCLFLPLVSLPKLEHKANNIHLSNFYLQNCCMQYSMGSQNNKLFVTSYCFHVKWPRNIFRSKCIREFLIKFSFFKSSDYFSIQAYILHIHICNI